MAKKKNINLFLEYESSAQQEISNDENRIKQIIINLIGNAFKFTLEGSIILKVQSKHSSQLRVIVQDTGVGIRDEDKGNLMIAFGKSETDENK